MLAHLMLVPLGGLCNRMRAIGSARRICEGRRARLSVVWDWGDPHALLAPDQGIEWLPRLPLEARGFLRVRHLLAHEGGDRSNRRVPTARTNRVLVWSHFVFSALEESPPIEEADLGPWLPRPAPAVRAAVARFAAAQLRGRMVGMHMRRTDNGTALRMSPDELFLAEARLEIDAGARIFLATDNLATEGRMREAFGEAIVTYPKRPGLARRWPRSFDARDTFDDMVDLFLLAGCEYVIGCAGSSYSRQAAIWNGSPLCRVLELPRRGTASRPARSAP